MKISLLLVLLATAPSLVATQCAAQPPTNATATLESQLVWTDENAVALLPLGTADGVLTLDLKTITRAGWGPRRTLTTPVRGGKINIAPLAEGLHIAQGLGEVPQTLRFLAMQPPAPLDATSRAALLKSLPRQGRKLLSGQPFKILAMGDSVTATGDYPQMLAMLLRRATGNLQISVVKHAYPGRSVDAAVRFWKTDGPPSAPDLGLLMYGLNDESGGVPEAAYLEQSRWIVNRLAEIGADATLLQPTPHIEIPLTATARTATSNRPDSIFRTIGLAESLRGLAQEMKVPLAQTFDALWQPGGDSLQASARAMWPLFPPSYSQPWESMLESGAGDTIHPNALGHLQMARAVFESLTTPPNAPPLQIAGVSSWTPNGVQSRLRVVNASRTRRAGRLQVGALTGGEIQAPPLAYDLRPGQQTILTASWPQARQPRDLLRYPNDRYLAPNRPLVPIVDFANGGSRVYVAPAPFAGDAHFVRERQVVSGDAARVGFVDEGQRREIAVPLPRADVGRVPLLRKVGAGWAAAELAFVRFGHALGGEAIVDGDLSEWSAHANWVPVGERVQARWTRGPEDHRVSPQECYLKWAFKAGARGIYFAARAVGKVEKDNFTLFFDPRAPELLGTAGRYYWASGALQEGGKIALFQGETSQSAPGLQGAWRKTPTGATLEVFVPYELMEVSGWPKSRDLGCSIVWDHHGAAGQITHLMWSEDGHPWNPRWYGVVRRVDETNPILPFMVRVK